MENDPNKLLDTFTRFLAYIGDEYARDGYTEYEKRDVELTHEETQRLMPNILNFLKSGEALRQVPKDIVMKIKALKEVLDTQSQERRDELFQYIEDYMEAGNMHGGAKKVKKTRSKISRKKSRKTRKAKR